MWRLKEWVVGKRPRVNAVVLGAFVLASAMDSSAQQDEAPPYSPGEAEVFIDPDERISGGARVGAAFNPESDHPKLDGLFVYFDRPPAQPLMLQLTSVDGRFLAKFPQHDWEPAKEATAEQCRPASGSPWHPADCSDGQSHLCGWVKLNLGDKVKTHLAGRKHDEIATLVLDQNSMAFPTRWGGCGQPASVKLYVNAEGAHAFFVTGSGTRDCVAASPSSGFKFDRICDVPLDEVTEDRIYILRKRGAGFSDPIEFDVVLPRIQ